MLASTRVLATATLIFSLLQMPNPASGYQVQAGQTPSASGEKAKNSGSDLGPAQAVITVQGICPSSEQKNAGTARCVMVITRDQFENLLNDLNPDGHSISP